MKKAIIAVLSAAAVVLIVKFILPIIMFIAIVCMNSDMTPKKDIFATVEQNQDVINAAAYVMYTNNIMAVYDSERNPLTDDTTQIEGDYIVRETDEYDTYYGRNKRVYEPLTDEYLLAALNLDGVKEITKDKNIIKLYFGGEGIVPSGAEQGVCYLPNDSLEDAEDAIPGYVGKSVPQPSGKGYMYSGYGDNTFYVERICDNLWFYKVTW